MCKAIEDLGYQVSIFKPSRLSDPLKNVSITEYYGTEIRADIVSLRHIDLSPIFRFLPGRKLVNAALALDGFIFSGKSARELKRRKVDLAYARDWDVAEAMVNHGIPTVLELHLVAPSGWQRKRIEKLSRNSNLRMIVAITEGVKSILETIGVSKEKLMVEPDAVDITDYESLPDRRTARSKFGMSNDADIAVYTGSFYGWKGVSDILLSAKASPEITYVLAGGEVDDLPDKKSRELSSLDNVIVLGRLNPTEIPMLQAAADVLLLPNSGKLQISSEFTSPLKMFEYMAARRPIVATDLPSLTEHLVNDVNAILVRPDDANDLAAGIRRALKNQQLSDQITTAAFEKVKSISWNARANRILERTR